MIVEHIVENNEFELENLLNIENISPKTLSLIKQHVYGTKWGKEKLEEKVKSLTLSLNKIKDDKKLKDSYYISGICLLVLGKIEESLEALEHLKSTKRSHFFMGKCYQELGKFKKAMDLFEQISDSDKDVNGSDYTVEVEIAATKRKSGDANGAKQVIKNIIKSHADDPDLYYQLGHCLDDIGEKEDAFKMYEKAVELDPNHAHALFRIAYCYDLKLEDEKAIEYYERCNQLPVKYVNSFLNLGILYEDKGEYKKAITCFGSVLKSDPNNFRARMYLKDAESSLTMYYDDEIAKRQDKNSDVLNIPISDFELSVRSRNCLEKMFITTLGDLTKVTEHELLLYKNFGETSLYEIRSILKQKGLRLGQALDQSQHESKSDLL